MINTFATMKSFLLLPLIAISFGLHAQSGPNWIDSDTVYNDKNQLETIANSNATTFVNYFYHANGNLAEEITTTIDGKSDYNRVRKYSLDGTLKETYFYTSRKQLLFTTFHYDSTYSYYSKEGNLLRVDIYKDDKLNGESIEYFPNGEIKKVETYIQGILHGVVQTFYSNGKLESNLVYQNGLLKDADYYTPNGEVLEKGNFSNGNGILHFYKNGVLKGKSVYKNYKLKSSICVG